MSNTQVKFRYIKIKNSGSGVDIYPQIRTADGKSVIWDGRANAGTYWLIPNGLDTVVDPVNDLNSSGYTIYPNSISANSEYRIGVNVVWGNDDWYMGDTHFIFDPSSSITILFHKYGGVRDGDLAYDGIQR